MQTNFFSHSDSKPGILYTDNSKKFQTASDE